MPNTPEDVSENYNQIMKKKIYEMISHTTFYIDEMDWSFLNIRYYFKNIKYLIVTLIIMFFDNFLLLFFIILIYILYGRIIN